MWYNMVKKGGQLMKQDMLARYQALKPYVRAGLSRPLSSYWQLPQLLMLA